MITTMHNDHLFENNALGIVIVFDSDFLAPGEGRRTPYILTPQDAATAPEIPQDRVRRFMRGADKAPIVYAFTGRDLDDGERSVLDRTCIVVRAVMDLVIKKCALEADAVSAQGPSEMLSRIWTSYNPFGA